MLIRIKLNFEHNWLDNNLEITNIFTYHYKTHVTDISVSKKVNTRLKKCI